MTATAINERAGFTRLTQQLESAEQLREQERQTRNHDETSARIQGREWALDSANLPELLRLRVSFSYGAEWTDWSRLPERIQKRVPLPLQSAFAAGAVEVLRELETKIGHRIY